MNRPCLFLIDDHPLYRSGLRMVLEAGLGALHLQEMASIEEALQATQRPDLLLVDILLGGMDGLSGIPLLQRQWPDAGLVMVASDASNDTVARALDAGASAFLSKAAPPQQMLETIRGVLSRRQPGRWPAAQARPASGAPACPLSQRQLQVLDLAGQGLSNRAIAQRLSLSEHTVRWHVHALLAALEAASRSEAVFMARQRGWLA